MTYDDVMDVCDSLVDEDAGADGVGDAAEARLVGATLFDLAHRASERQRQPVAHLQQAHVYVSL